MSNYYPRVIGEYETLEELHQGKSIARYGDGEIKICRNGNNVSQKKDPRLGEELRNIIRAGSTKKLCVGIPPLDNMMAIPEGKKREFWQKQLPITSRFLTEGHKYHSSFITRSDNTPHIDTVAFWNRLVDLWRDKDITLVIGSERSLCDRNTSEAKSVTYVEGTYRDSYDVIDRVQADIVKAGNNTVILCLGATATALAGRLCNDYHALDLGHVGLKGMFKKGRGLI